MKTGLCDKYIIGQTVKERIKTLFITVLKKAGVELTYFSKDINEKDERVKTGLCDKYIIGQTINQNLVQHESIIL